MPLIAGTEKDQSRVQSWSLAHLDESGCQRHLFVTRGKNLGQVQALILVPHFLSSIVRSKLNLIPHCPKFSAPLPERGSILAELLQPRTVF